MQNLRFLRYCQDSRVILALILLVFFLKGVFLVTLQPIFGGQDEARHYNTLQYLAEPKGAVPKDEKKQKANNDRQRDKDNFDTYNFSEEIQRTASGAGTDILRGEIYNTIPFSDSSEGLNESTIRSGIWKPYNYYEEPDIAGTGSSLYHRTASQIERLFSSQDILVRFYLIRIFSVILGTFAVFLTYRIATTIGFSSKISLILTALLAFQPKFSLYLTNINYDALLIPSFFLFTLAGTLALKRGINWRNFTLLLLSMLIATETKGTGYILVVVFLVLMSYFLHERVRLQSKHIRYSIYATCLVATAIATAILYTHFLGGGGATTGTIRSLADYLSRTITFGKFILPSGTYWGTLSWVNSFLLSNVTNIIFIIETSAIIGLGLLFFAEKFQADYPSFLPAKKYIVFLIGMIVALQLGIRLADWHVFSQIGGMKMSLGTPGRYFLPNLASHILLVGAGIGALLASFKKEEYFETALLTLFIGMLTLMTYLIFDVIILRFYF